MKLRNKIFVLMVAIVMMFSIVGCATIKDGSKITTAVMTIDFYKADGTIASTSEVTLELYENNAPETVAHVKKLIKDKYYDGVCISNVANHFVEFGEYQYTDNSSNDITKNFAKKDYDLVKYGTVAGQFHNNGYGNQRLNAGTGAIVMKHDRVGQDKYNTATSGIMLMTSGLVDIDKNNYCVIGKMVTDDGEASLKDASAELDAIDRSSLSSFGIINSIHDIDVLNNDDGSSVITYYQLSTQKWFKLVRANNETHVYDITEGEVELTVSEKDKFINEVENTTTSGGFKDEYYDYFKLPYQKIIVRSIKIK